MDFHDIQYAQTKQCGSGEVKDQNDLELSVRHRRPIAQKAVAVKLSHGCRQNIRSKTIRLLDPI